MISRKHTFSNILPFLLLAVLIIVLVKSPVSIASSEVTRCKTAQQNLSSSVRSRDLRTRVDRIQAYQYMYQKLDIFVQRLENNNQPAAAELRQQTDSLGKQITKFKDDYETYDKSRSEVSKIVDCDKNRVAFDRALQNARDSRNVLHQDVVDIDDTLNTPIQTSIRNLYIDLLASAPTGVSNE